MYTYVYIYTYVHTYIYIYIYMVPPQKKKHVFIKNIGIYSVLCTYEVEKTDFSGDSPIMIV